MDCSKTEVFLAEWERMCDSTFLNNCTLCQLYGRKGDGCSIYVRQYPEEAIKIVQEWSDLHPVKTRLSVLKEHFPNYRRDDNGEPGEPEICAEDLFGINCPYPVPGKGVCMKCWNTPIEDDNNA